MLSSLSATLMVIVIVWVLLPTVPALIMFKLLPGDKINVSGVLGNFKINASGAIGAYFAVLVAIPFFTDKLKTQFVPVAEPRQYWTVTGDIDLRDVKGEHMPMYLHRSELKVATDPEYYSIDSNTAKLTVRVVKGDSGFPSIRIYSDKFAPQFVAIDEASSQLEFKDNNIIHIKQPLQIREDPASIKKTDLQNEIRATGLAPAPPGVAN